MPHSSSLDPMQAFAELGRINLAELDLQQVLARISQLAKQAIPGATEVSVTLLQGGHAHTAAFTGELAIHLDESQYEKGHGPCLAAAAGLETMLIADMATEDRWPDYTPEALRRGAHSSVSVGLPVQDAVSGALNLYATMSKAFDEDAVELARTFAGYAAVALSNAHLYSSTAALAQQMQEAMDFRATIEQAKGILMAERGCTPEEAFDLLVRASQAADRRLRDIADSIVRGAQPS